MPADTFPQHPVAWTLEVPALPEDQGHRVELVEYRESAKGENGRLILVRPFPATVDLGRSGA
jgi:hypothetical protein